MALQYTLLFISYLLMRFELFFFFWRNTERAMRGMSIDTSYVDTTEVGNKLEYICILRYYIVALGGFWQYLFYYLGFIYFCGLRIFIFTVYFVDAQNFNSHSVRGIECTNRVLKNRFRPGYVYNVSLDSRKLNKKKSIMRIFLWFGVL